MPTCKEEELYHIPFSSLDLTRSLLMIIEFITFFNPKKALLKLSLNPKFISWLSYMTDLINLKHKT